MRKNRFQAWIHLIISGILFMSLLPLLFMVIQSLRAQIDYDSSLWSISSGMIGFQNYSAVLSSVYPYVFNTFTYSIATVAGVLAVSTLTAYIFARFSFPLKQLLFSSIIALMMIPGILTFIPQFLMVFRLNLLDTPWALILPGISGGLIFAVYLLRTFFEQIAMEIIEAARIDGAPEWRIIGTIVVPLSIPTLATIGVLNFLWMWNAYIWPLVTLSSSEKWTVSIGMAFLSNAYGGANEVEQYAAYTLSSIPLLILFIIAMKYFLQGINSGMLKG